MSSKALLGEAHDGIRRKRKKRRERERNFIHEMLKRIWKVNNANEYTWDLNGSQASG